MSSLRRALLYGLLIWLVPFAVALAAFPVKQSWRSLFESIMPLTLALIVVTCAVAYFHRAATPSQREGLLLGGIWMAMSVAIDLPLMLSPPISYTLGEYAADIGLTYLMIPVITTGIAWAAARRATP
jgi:hypothetical protein